MARYDRAIPPGGKGKVTLKIDSSSVRGEFEKKAIVWSNDPDRMSVALYLKGKVNAHISLEPGGYIPIVGIKGEAPLGHVEIINHHESPVKITGVDNDLPDRIRWRIEEISPGFVYRLEVEDISKKEGNYTAHLTIRTDNPNKPELTHIVRGEIREK